MSPEERKKTTPRTIMIGGKAFATYTNAKRIVKLVDDVGAVVNNDLEVNSYLKVENLYKMFLQCYNFQLWASVWSKYQQSRPFFLFFILSHAELCCDFCNYGNQIYAFGTPIYV